MATGLSLVIRDVNNIFQFNFLAMIGQVREEGKLAEILG